MTGAAAPRGASPGRPTSGGGSREQDTARRKIEPIPGGAVPVMEAINISKAFGATTALVDVSLRSYAGRILALLGDNGAGKSTLIKILSGVFPPDRGELRFRGSPVRFENPAEARQLGIATVFQDLAVCELLSVTRNVVLGREPLKGVGPFKWFDMKRADPKAVEAELRAQIDTAIDAGLDVTHLDAHMGTALCPEFVDIYVQLGLDYKAPILLVKDYDAFNPRSYSGPMSNDNYDAALMRAKAAGFAVFDVVQETMWDRKADAPTAYGELFRNIPEGLTFLSLHFNAPGDFEVIEPSYAHIRTDEYALFKSGETKRWAEANGVEVVGMRELRDDLRSRWAKTGLTPRPPASS